MANSSSSVVFGDKRRAREALELAFNDYLHSDNTEISAVIRNAIERGWTSKIKGVLREFESSRDKEIDKICFLHYSEFLDSVTELLQMKKQIKELKNNMNELHQEFSLAGSELLDAMTEVERAAAERDHAADLYYSAFECHQVTQLMSDAKEAITIKNFHKAVNILQKIKNNQSSRIQFLTDHIINPTWLPDVQKQLLLVETREADKFLSEIRLDAPLFGSTLLRRQVHLFKQRNDIIDNYTFSTSSIWRNSSIYHLENWYNIDIFEKITSLHFTQSPSEEGEIKLNEFFERMGPLTHCMHSYSVLSRLAAFAEHYREGRQIELDYIFTGAQKAVIKYGLINTFSSMISSLTGLFAIESFFGHCITEFDNETFLPPFSPNELSDLWSLTCSRLKNLCLKFTDSLNNPNEILSLKEDIILTIDTTSDSMIELPSGPLIDIIISFWPSFISSYCDYIKKSSMVTLEQNLSKPFQVKNLQYFQSNIVYLGLETDDMYVDPYSANRSSKKYGTVDTSDNRNVSTDSNLIFPKTFQFSSALPKILQEIYLAIAKCGIFAFKCQQSPIHSESICQMIVQLLEEVCNSYQHYLAVDGNDTTISKACQIAIDTSALLGASASVWNTVERMITYCRWTDALTTHFPMGISSSKTIIDRICAQAQDAVNELLCSKVDDLLTTLSFINPLPTTTPTECHPFIDEIIDFLRITFMGLVGLPKSAAEAAHFTCCSHVATGIIHHLISPKFSVLNTKCLQTFEIDILKLHRFADDCKVPHLRHSFNEITDLIALLLSSDIDNVALDRESCMKRYPCLNTNHVAIILEKCVPFDGVIGRDRIPIANMDKTKLRALAKQFRNMQK